MGHDEPAKTWWALAARAPSGGSGLETRTRRPQATPGAARRWSSRAAASIAIASTTAGRASARTFPSIGSRRTPVRLRQALVAPDEEVVPDNRFVRIVTKDGATVTGKLLNQDAISVQMMNPKEELKTYLRANASRVHHHRQGVDAVRSKAS